MVAQERGASFMLSPTGTGSMTPNSDKGNILITDTALHDVAEWLGYGDLEGTNNYNEACKTGPDQVWQRLREAQ